MIPFDAILRPKFSLFELMYLMCFLWVLVDDVSIADSPYFTMYSDDDPSVMMDYDFKDLNSINRATGETVSWIIKA